MNTVYFFYKAGQVRVPLQFFDGAALSLLKTSGIGFWDSENHQFVVAAEFVTKAVISHLFNAFAQVFVDESGDEAKITRIVWNTPWLRQQRAAPEPLQPAVRLSQPETAPRTPGTPAAMDGQWQAKLNTEMAARRYSVETRSAYLHYNRELCAFARKQPPEIGSDDIKAFLADLHLKRNLSASSMNLAISALKFFYQRMLGRNIVNEQRRPVQDKHLPAVLAKSEVRKILETLKNPKHRLLLMLVYSGGLRVSEVVKLRREDIDFERKTLFIRAAKGRKDRYVMLSEVAAAALRAYLPGHNGAWLFPGQPAANHLSTRSAQKVFDQTLGKR